MKVYPVIADCYCYLANYFGRAMESYAGDDKYNK